LIWTSPTEFLGRLNAAYDAPPSANIEHVSAT
jgi:hypothetical protein